jgi:hypothetical protein
LVATTANIALTGLQTIDGVVLAANDRVLVKNQTNTTTNGIYEANTSGWSRAPDFDGVRDAVSGTLVIVRNGTDNGNTVWELTTANPVAIGTDALTFTKALLDDTATAVFIQNGTGAVEQTAQDKLRDWGTAEGYGALGDGATDDTAAIIKCLNAKGACYLIPGKTYVCDNVILPAGACIFSVGRAATLKQKFAVASTGMLYANSGSASATLDNISIFGVTLEGQVATQGFAEFVHLISVNGVRNFRLDDCLLKGFRGDALYLGSGIVAGDERHNYNVRVTRTDFDGVNNDNRNAVSVIDVDGLTIKGCGFKNCTRPNMPGPIDLEPDALPFHVIRNVRIANNTGDNIGGNVGFVSVLVPAAVTAAPRNIRVLNNTLTNYVGTGAFFTFTANRAPTATSENNDVQVIGNHGKTGGLPLQIFDGKGIVTRDNTWEDFTASTLIGYTGAAQKVLDLEVDDTYIRCGSNSGSGVVVYQLDHAKIKGKLVDCGKGVAGSANGIDFNTGTSSYIDIEELEISSPTGKTLVGIQKEAGHTFAASTNRYVNNNLNGLSNAFQADYSDELETAWLPIVTGSSSAGAGVYTAGQYGRLRRMGKKASIRGKVQVSAGHTGTGMIQIPLPIAAKAASNNEETPVSLLVTGVATTGGHVGLINPAVGSTGAIRCYYTGTGTMGQTAIPAGAFTVYFSAEYETA